MYAKLEKPFFFDLAGKPLDGGYIYVGEPNRDPEVYPVTAYYDPELSVIAPQPLRTVNGYISRSGAPADIYTAESVSVRVKDKLGVQVYYETDTAPSAGLDASEIGYANDKGLESTTVSDALNEIWARIPRQNYLIDGEMYHFTGTAANSWPTDSLGSTKVDSKQVYASGAAPQPSIRNFARTVVTSVSGAANYVRRTQRIDDVRALNGRKATVSFYAKSTAAGKRIAVSLFQDFGAGGSTSIDIPAQKVSLETFDQLYTLTFDIPSVAGKTIGTGSNLTLVFWFDAGSNLDDRTDSLGQQSGTFDLTGVRMVEGEVAGDYEPDARLEGFDALLANPGFHDFPSGLRIQWVRNLSVVANSSGDASIVFTYPEPFRFAVFGQSFYLVDEAGNQYPATATIQGTIPLLNSITVKARGLGSARPVAISGFVAGI